MPQIQVLDLSPSPRKEATPLENVLSGFSKRMRQNQIEQEETDALADIYRDYKQEGKTLDDAIMDVQTKPGISPTTRVNTVNQLMNLKKTNAALQERQDRANAKIQSADEKAKKEAAKAQEKVDKDEEKKRIEAELDEKEIDFLDSLEGQNLKPTEIYKLARQHGIPRTRANSLATLHRLESKEGRLSEGDITRQYDFEIREIDKQLKDVMSEKAKEPLKKQRAELVKQRRSDLAKWRSGDRDFKLAMHEAIETEQPTEQEEIQAAQEVVKDAFIDLLTETFPPDKIEKDTIKWLPANKSPDGKKHSYKSDGKKWVQQS